MMWSFIVDKIGSRKAAEIKSALVFHLPSGLLRTLNNRVLTLVPQPFYTKNVIFVHVPKAAGTSIAISLYGERVSHQPATMLRKADPQFWEQAYKFAVVRDPYDRLLSAYFYLRMGGTEEAPIDDTRDMAGINLSSIDQMVEWLEQNFVEVQKYNYVLWPQHLFVCDENGVPIVDQIFRLENLEPLQQVLQARGFITGEIPHTNKIEASEQANRNQLSERTKRKIAKMYSKDFSIFGYST